MIKSTILLSLGLLILLFQNCSELESSSRLKENTPLEHFQSHSHYLADSVVSKNLSLASKANNLNKSSNEINRSYNILNIEGWEVRISKEINTSLVNELKLEIQKDLNKIKNILPRKIVSSLLGVKIFVHDQDKKGKHLGAVFHPNYNWLVSNGYNPEMYNSVEIANAKNYLSWKKRFQPGMILHELAHAYYFLFMNSSEIRNLKHLFSKIKASNKYKNVSTVYGRNSDAYARINVMEYFAESIESFYKRNDFYPYKRSDLKTYDLKVFNLIKNLGAEKTTPSEVIKVSCRGKWCYHVDYFLGWTISYSSKLTESKQLFYETRAKLRESLRALNGKLNSYQLRKSKRIKIFVNKQDSNGRFLHGTLHGGRQWLIQNNYDPYKEHSIEISNSSNFLRYDGIIEWLVYYTIR